MTEIQQDAPKTTSKPSSELPPGLKARAWYIWRQHVLPLIVVVVVLTTLRSAIADWNDVPTGSMKPSIIEGDRIFVNKLAYGLKVPFTTIHVARWDTPERGEIVVFFSPLDGTRLVKRVVGLPGDTIEIRDNRLFINGESVEYEPLADPAFRNALPPIERPYHTYAMENLDGHLHPVIDTPTIATARRWLGPIEVPEGQYFMLGDNRDNSHDSRYIGMVPEDQIVGRASRVAMSFDYERWFMPRWERFLKPLP